MAATSTELEVLTVAPDAWSAHGQKCFDRVRRAVASATSAELIVLPELIGGEDPPHVYERHVLRLAKDSGAWVIGGSHHDHSRREVVNRGIVAAPEGRVVAEYSKRHPFDSERSAGVVSGAGPTAFDSPWGVIAIAICADFFHWELLAGMNARLLAVPAFSVTRSHRQALARTVWRCSAVARAYELGSYVVVSDWPLGAPYGAAAAAGASGLADPTAADEAGLFNAATTATSRWRLDFGRIDAVRAQRRTSGFLDPRRERGAA